MGCVLTFIGGLIGAVAGPIIILKGADLKYPDYSSDGIGVAGALVLGTPMGTVVGAVLGYLGFLFYNDWKNKKL